MQAVAAPTLTTALGCAAAASSSIKAMAAQMASPDWPPRLRDEGVAGAAAMPPRLRRATFGSAPPCLPCACKLCEASFPTSDELRAHVRHVHGGD